MSRYDPRRHELLKKVEEARGSKESADKEFDLAVGAALAGGYPVKHVAEFAGVSRQSLYRSHNAAETGVRARRQSVERLREQLRIDKGDDAASACVWPEDAPKLGSNTADKRPEHARRESAGPPHTPKPGDDLLGTILPPEPWGPEHASELARAIAAPLVYKARCYHDLWMCKTYSHIDSDDWVHHAVVLRDLLKVEVERKMFAAWFKLVPVPEDDRTPEEQEAVHAAMPDSTVTRWMTREDLDEWGGRVVAYKREGRLG